MPPQGSLLTKEYFIYFMECHKGFVASHDPQCCRVDVVVFLSLGAGADKGLQSAMTDMFRKPKR